MSHAIILGAGAAPGVPSLSSGWGFCDETNPNNRRRRTGTYYNFNGVEILVDTSPDLRQQLLDNQIKRLDGVLYTHTHADHLHGIDDLREINRITAANIDFYAVPEVMKIIKKRFGYLICNPKEIKDVIRCPSLVAHKIKCNHEFYIKDVKITPLKLCGHNVPSNGYLFNDGEVAHIADFKWMPSSTLKLLTNNKIKTLVIPLTTPFGQKYHAGWDEILNYIKQINPQKVIINHMASECDYETIAENAPNSAFPAYDNMKIEL
ncbi:MAG: MBL fold metallo-hydrolase [Alphaproteobacteria bacterium]|nr:MBL fold metallo-hydrolase [Alphaproteobacteria bacterium]